MFWSLVSFTLLSGVVKNIVPARLNCLQLFIVMAQHAVSDLLLYLLLFSVALVQWAMAERSPMPRAPGIFPVRTAMEAR